ncbi:hypothetical protein [Salipiger bermudensis]|uniref:hypothetical protein n=1 Tax=Salipiger bermudensis TaxID=344736 RepID=UPI001CD4C48F|nr:hypothetical protein [Salipiger bermudensis]MCA0964986.1 hypothetical protein [Salipiger bermudensis]
MWPRSFPFKLDDVHSISYVSLPELYHDVNAHILRSSLPADEYGIGSCNCYSFFDLVEYLTVKYLKIDLECERLWVERFLDQVCFIEEVVGDGPLARGGNGSILFFELNLI